LGVTAPVMTPSFSVSLRLRRVTVETAHVSVPLTTEFVTGSAENLAKLDTEKQVQAAINMGRVGPTLWQADGEAEITLRPLQTPPEP
jgi:hypothetical protein